MKKRLIIVCFMLAIFCCSCGATYECSRCKNKVSEAYYDPFGSYEYLCGDCAESYFSPMPYSNYKVTEKSNGEMNNIIQVAKENYEKNLQVENAITEAENLSDNKQYEDAINLLEETMEMADVTQQEEIRILIERINNEYRDETILLIKEYIEMEEYDLALEVSEKAVQQLWENDMELYGLYEEVLKYIPKFFGNLKCVSEGIEKKRTPYSYYDTSGNQYETAHRFWTTSVYSKETEILYDVYSLNGQYAHLSAIVAPSSRMTDICDETDDTIIYVFGDGKELFSTYVNKNSSPVAIELDITGVSELKIGMRGGNLVQILFADAYIYEKY